MIRNRPSSVVRLLTAGWGGAWLGEGRRQRRRLAGGQDLPCHRTTHRGELPPFDLCLASPAGLRAPLFCPSSVLGVPAARLRPHSPRFAPTLITLRPGHKAPEGYLLTKLQRHRRRESILSENSLGQINAA